MPQVNFSKDIAPIIIQILKDNNLEETDDQFVEKLKQDIPLNGAVCRFLIEEAFLQGYSKNNLASLLRKDLEINPDQAQKLADAIDLQIIPYAEKDNSRPAPQEMETPINEKNNSAQNNNIEKENSDLELPPAKKQTTFTKPPQIKRTGPDAYREPIE